MFIGQTDGTGVSAMVGTPPGSGTVTLYKRSTTGIVETISTDITAYNISQTAVGANTNVMVMQDNFGTYWVIVEDCG